MNKQKSASYMIILGIVILGIFTYVTVLNVFDDKVSSNQLFSKTETGINATIEEVKTENDRLIVTTSGDAQYSCIKTTKTPPKQNALCWTKIENNITTTSTYTYKTYYIWIKDSNNTISEAIKYNIKD